MRPFTTQKIYSLVFMYFKSMGASKMHIFYLPGLIWSWYVIFVLVYIKCVFVLDAGMRHVLRQVGGATGNR